jgi:hypothetical protein
VTLGDLAMGDLAMGDLAMRRQAEILWDTSAAPIAR